MPTGLKIPLGVDKTGGSAWVSSESNDQKTINTALSDCNNENAFQQDLGLGAVMIFDINDNNTRASILRKLIAIFKDFEDLKRYKLKRDSIKWTTDSDTQELILEFDYFNLENDELTTLRKVFKQG